jgi:hypothetical protein
MPEYPVSIWRRLLLLSLIPAAGVVLFLVGRGGQSLPRLVNTAPRTAQVMEWLRSDGARLEWQVPALARCGSAPFLFPTTGFIGFIWDDSFYPGHRHQGLDIFSGTASGQTPVYTPYDGYLTRLDSWISSLILRIPQDPLQPQRQIWLYFTHMADGRGRDSFIARDFPQGTQEVYVPAGTLLGYQGDYSGDPGNPVGVHLHFSIVQDDGQGRFRNELEIRNTLDPSPYFGLPLNANANRDILPVCPPDQLTPAP